MQSGIAERDGGRHNERTAFKKRRFYINLIYKKIMFSLKVLFF
jgi:hypothetical protein